MRAISISVIVVFLLSMVVIVGCDTKTEKEKVVEKEKKQETPGKDKKPVVKDAETFESAIANASTCKPKDFACPQLISLKKFMAKFKEYGPEDFRKGMKLTQNPNVQNELIRKIKPKVDDALIPEIEPYAISKEFILRQTAQSAIAYKGSDLGLSKLVALLDNKDHSETLRTGIPKLLAKFAENPIVKAAVPKLKLMAKDCVQGWGRADAATAVAKIEGEAAIPFLIEVAQKDKWNTVRVKAIHRLGKYFKTKKVAAELKKLAKDKDAKVKDAAEKALKGEFENIDKPRKAQPRVRPTPMPAPGTAPTTAPSAPQPPQPPQ